MITWLAYILGSWLLADFIAGLFHWWEDSYLSQDTPLLGNLIGGPNSLHHSSPTAFLRGSYWHRNYTTIIPAAIACGVCLWFGHWLWLTMAFLTQANQIHCYGHQGKRNPVWVRWLQSVGIFQSVKHHGLHHRSPFAIRYCVMSNYLNWVLDGSGFWRGLEYVVFVVTGYRAREKDAATN